MPESISNLQPLIVAAVIFVVVVVVFLVFARRAGSSSVDARLSQIAGRDVVASTEETAFRERVDQVVRKGGRGSKIARDLARADLKLTVAEFIGLKILSSLLLCGFGVFLGRAGKTGMIAVGAVGLLVGWFVPDLIVSFLQRKRITAFNNQLGDTIGLLANSLRSGYSLLQSMELVSREAPPPISNEFRRVVQEVGLGLSTSEALQNMYRRVPSEDLDLMVTAINIQFEVGGNLAQILETIAHTIRERVRIKGQIKTLTAQARISGYVITFMPVALAIMISTINPEYIAPIFTFGMPPEDWCCLPLGSAVMMFIGFLVIRKIVDIEV
ncbi:MAG: secretion system protein [Herpetosiphonaceae bacterium]|nr:MAG: secretion system protein [Herpetosiphonaceae bacterium]